MFTLKDQIDNDATPASTVIIIRGDEVFTQERARTMGFAPGFVAFPGGGARNSDTTIELSLNDSSLPMSIRTGYRNRDEYSMYLSCGVREVFEETGVFLPGGKADEYRAGIADHTYGLKDVLAGVNGSLRGDELVPFARWVTPPDHDKKYDVGYFAVNVDDDCEPDGNTTESVRSEWNKVSTLLSRWSRREIDLNPATYHSLMLIDSGEDITSPDSGFILSGQWRRSGEPDMEEFYKIRDIDGYLL